MKFGEVYLLRYLITYVDVCCIISGNSGRIAIKLKQNVSKILLFNTSKSKLRYSNFFRNVSVLNESHLANFAENRLPWERPLRNWEKGPDQ